MSEVVLPEPVAPDSTRSEQVVEELREPGLDLPAAWRRLESEVAGRRRRRLVSAGVGLVVIGLVAAGAWMVGQRGDDVETTSGGTSTTTLPVPSTSTPEAIAVAPVTTSSTVPASAGVAPPVDPVARSPLGAELSVPRGVRVGTPFTLAIDWNDADHAAAGEPTVEVEWNDPYLAPAAAEPPPSSCGSAGSPRAGRIERTFRYSTAGSRSIVVRLQSCSGSGGFAEDLTVELPVDVGAVSGTPLVAAVDPAAGDPDVAEAVRYPADAGGAQTLANRSTAVDQVLRRDRGQRATVLVADSWAAGDVLLLQFPDASCRWATLGSAAGGAAAVLTQSGCQPERPTTTVPSTTAPSTTSTSSSTTTTSP